MRAARIAFGAIAVMTVTALGFFVPALMANQTSRWDVVAANNAFVSHRNSDAATSVSVGATVTPGDRLTTKAGGALVLARGEDLVTMAENTQIFIVDPQPAGATLIDESYGLVRYHVTKEPEPHFEVDTPLLATVVKGTTFTVSANASQSAVAVSEGRVEARDVHTGSVSSVGAGQVGAVKIGGQDVQVQQGGDATGSSTDDGSGGADKGSNGNGNNGNGNNGNGNGNGNNGNNGNGNGNGGGNNGNGNGNGGGNGKGNNGNGKGNSGN